MLTTTKFMARIADLWRLQEIDLALDMARARLEDAQGQLEEPDSIEASRRDVEERATAARAAQSSQKDIDLQAQQLRDKIGPAEQKLYDGSIRNPRELSDLQKEVDSLKEHLATLEDQDIEALSQAEAADAASREAQAALQTAESQWRDTHAEVTSTIARLEQDIAAQEVQRKEQAQLIEPEVLRTYDHIRRAHQGRAVAKLDRSLCLGCRISLPQSVVTRSRQPQALVQCPNCERILFG